MFGFTVLSLLYKAIDVAFLGLIAWALADAVMRPADDFTYASQKKPFWVTLMVLGLFVGVDRTFMRVIFMVPSIIKWLLFWGCIFGAVYYLGTERRKMGPGGLRWPFGKGGGENGSAGNSRGTW